MIGAPNALAYLVLLVWPFVALALVRGMGPVRGMLAALIGAYLLLPPGQAAFELPILPSINRDFVGPGAAFLACWLMHRSKLRILPESRGARALLLLYLASPILTALSNLDPIYDGRTYLPAMKLIEVPSLVLGKFVDVTPFLLGRSLLGRTEGQRTLLWALVLATLAYTLPMLVEIRLSPQINVWVYGFFQHSFAQMMREGGFRPLVFLFHGLWAAFLVSSAVMAACALLRSETDGRRTVQLVIAALWLFVILVLCKSLGSLLYALAIAPLVLLLSSRGQVRLAVMLGTLAFAYPLLRGSGIVPTEALTGLADLASAERAQSLGFRFDNEGLLLGHALERPLFGWGSWGRNLVYDPATGQSITVTDGRWIITLGVWGWAGYIAEFGLVLFPILLAWRRGGTNLPRTTAGLCLMIAVNLVDMIPNATMTPLTFLLAGTVLGWAERPSQASDRRQPDRPAGPAIPVLLGTATKPRVETMI